MFLWSPLMSLFIFVFQMQQFRSPMLKTRAGCFFLMHVCCRFLYLIPDYGIGPNIIVYPLVFGFRSTKLLAQTTLRNVLGTKTLTEMLSDREQISLQIQVKFTNSNHYFVFRLLYLGNSR